MTIAAAIDDSASAEHVIVEAVELSHAFQDELQIIHVIEKSDLNKGIGETEGPTSRTVKQQAEDIVSQAASNISENFIPIGLIGDPASEIIRYTNKSNIDYLVIGGRQRSPVGKALFGSTTQRILLNADCRVVTINIRENTSPDQNK